MSVRISNNTLEVFNPATGEEITSLPTDRPDLSVAAFARCRDSTAKDIPFGVPA